MIPNDPGAQLDLIRQLLSNDLAFLLVPALLFQRLVWLNFFESAHDPTIPKRVLWLAQLVFALGLAYGNTILHPEAVTAVAQLWPVQGVLFVTGLLLADFLLEKTYRTPLPEGSVVAPPTSGDRLPGFALVAAALTLLAPAAQAGTPPLSLDRLSGGLAAQAAIYTGAVSAEDPGTSATFAPKAWLSYSVLDEVSAHASAQWGLGAHIDEYHAGGAVRLLREDPVRVAAGVDAVWYDGVDPGGLSAKPVVEYSLRFSKVLKRNAGAPRLGVQFQAGWIPAHTPASAGGDTSTEPDPTEASRAPSEFTYRVGLSWHAFGGKVLP